VCVCVCVCVRACAIYSFTDWFYRCITRLFPTKTSLADILQRDWNISTQKGARMFVLKRNQDGRSEWSHQWRVAGNAKGTLSRGTSGSDQCNF